MKFLTDVRKQDVNLTNNNRERAYNSKSSSYTAILQILNLIAP